MLIYCGNAKAATVRLRDRVLLGVDLIGSGEGGESLGLRRAWELGRETVMAGADCEGELAVLEFGLFGAERGLGG